MQIHQYGINREVALGLQQSIRNIPRQTKKIFVFISGQLSHNGTMRSDTVQYIYLHSIRSIALYERDLILVWTHAGSFPYTNMKLSLSHFRIEIKISNLIFSVR